VRTLEEQIRNAKASRQIEAEGLQFLQDLWLDATGCPEVFQARSALRFMRLLSIEQIRDAVEAAGYLIDREPEVAETPGQVWKYFCGACWTMVRRDREAKVLTHTQQWWRSLSPEEQDAYRAKRR
jgi:hypothetical protein